MANYVSPVNQFLRSIDVQPYDRYLPNAFNETLSLLEKVNKIVHHMNESNQLSNELIEKWNELVEWVNGEEFLQSVDQKINEMLNDGTLIDKINEELLVDIRKDLTNLSTVISKNKSDIEFSVNQVNEDVSSNTQRIETVETKTNTHVTDITSLKSKTATHDTDIAGLKNTTGTHTTDITGLKNTTATQTTDITGLKTKTTTHDTDIAGLKTTTGTQTTDITGLKNNKADKTALTPIQNSVSAINGLRTDSKTIYVNGATGNDSTGDGTTEKPFKTIQKAANTVPKIIDKDHFILCTPGDYDEYVVIQAINGAALTIKSTLETVDPSTGGTGFNVKGVAFFDCHAYCVVQQATLFNPDTLSSRGQIVFSRCMYGSVGNCRFASDTKSASKPCIIWDGSTGSMQSNYFNNQYRCMFSMNGGQVRVDASNTHGSQLSGQGYISQAATVFKNGTPVFTATNCTQPETKLQGGQIW